MTRVTATSSLSGWSILVTRPIAQANELASALRERGGTPLNYPTIEIGPPPSWAAFDEAAARLSAYDWIVFASPSAVRAAVDRRAGLAVALGLASRAPFVAAVGAETARALRDRGARVDLVPDDQRQEGLAAAFPALSPGARVLFPQAIGGRELLSDVLAARGASVDVVPVSQTRPLALAEAPPPFDVATFASPSALRAFVGARGAEALADKVVAVIGPTTLQAARDAGVRVHVVAARPSVAALVDGLADFRGRPAVVPGIG